MLNAIGVLAHSEKQGYPYILQQPNVQKFVPKTYAKYVVYLSGSPLPSASLYPDDKSSIGRPLLTSHTLRSNYTYTPRKLRIHHSTLRARFSPEPLAHGLQWLTSVHRAAK